MMTTPTPASILKGKNTPAESEAPAAATPKVKRPTQKNRPKNRQRKRSKTIHSHVIYGTIFTFGESYSCKCGERFDTKEDGLNHLNLMVEEIKEAKALKNEMRLKDRVDKNNKHSEHLTSKPLMDEPSLVNYLEESSVSDE